MKHVLFAAFLALLLTVPGLARAASDSDALPEPDAPQTAAPEAPMSPALTQPPPKARLADVGQSYQHFAAELGCTEFAGGSVSPDGSVFTLKYFPEGTTATHWTKMVVLTVYGLSGDRRKDFYFVPKQISTLEAQYAHMGTVTEDKNYLGVDQMPMMFMEYTMGPTNAKIYGAAVFKRVGTTTVALIQLQSPTPIPRDVAMTIHKMVNPLAGGPPPPKVDPDAGKKKKGK